MNTPKLRSLIDSYKANFDSIHQEEIYKWRAVRCFQNHWDINAPDFAGMFEATFKQSSNLLVSRAYYPLRVIRNYIDYDAKTVRRLFEDLYNEEEDLIGRIIGFRAGMNRKIFHPPGRPERAMRKSDSVQGGG